MIVTSYAANGNYYCTYTNVIKISNHGYSGKFVLHIHDERGDVDLKLSMLEVRLEVKP